MRTGGAARSIPAAMVEAAARTAHERSVREKGITGLVLPWSDLHPAARKYWLNRAAEDLGAALGVCEVHEQWQATLDEGQGYPCSGWWLSSRRAEATQIFKWAKSPLTRWERRWVYATPPEPEEPKLRGGLPHTCAGDPAAECDVATDALAVRRREDR